MINGVLQLSGFGYRAVDVVSPEGKPCKILIFKDAQANAEIHFTFLQEEFDQFVAKISDTGIVPAREMPRIVQP
jgi:hypothetical protein